MLPGCPCSVVSTFASGEKRILSSSSNETISANTSGLIKSAYLVCVIINYSFIILLYISGLSALSLTFSGYVMFLNSSALITFSFFAWTFGDLPLNACFTPSSTLALNSVTNELTADCVSSAVSFTIMLSSSSSAVIPCSCSILVASRDKE